MNPLLLPQPITASEPLAEESGWSAVRRDRANVPTAQTARPLPKAITKPRSSYAHRNAPTRSCQPRLSTTPCASTCTPMPSSPRVTIGQHPPPPSSRNAGFDVLFPRRCLHRGVEEELINVFSMGWRIFDVVGARAAGTELQSAGGEYLRSYHQASRAWRDGSYFADRTIARACH
jgi:hypothetical protein